MVIGLIVGLILRLIAFYLAHSKFEVGQQGALASGILVCVLCMFTGLFVWLFLGVVLGSLLKLDF